MSDASTKIPPWAYRVDVSDFCAESVAASLERPIGREKPYYVCRAGWTKFGKAISTVDPIYWDALVATKELLDKVPLDKSQEADNWDGFYRGSTNFDGFERWGSLMGNPAQPVPQPPNDSRVFREERGLRPMNKEELEIAAIVADIALPHSIRAERIYFDKLSSGGLPGRLKDFERLQVAQRPFAEAEKAVPMLLAGDLQGYYNYFQLVHMSSPVYRDQAERRGKKRIAQNFAGDSVTTDPVLPEPLRSEAPDLAYCCRRRLANAIPDVGADEAMLADAIKETVDSNIGYTCINRTAEQIVEKAAMATGCSRDDTSDLCFVGFDVDNCDQTIDPAMVGIWVNVIADRCGPFWAARMLMIIRMPALYRQTEPGKSGYYASGLPFDLSKFKTWYTNPSGHRATSQMAQLAGITYGVIAAIKAGLITKNRADILAFLQGGKKGACFFNAGDNILFAVAGTERRKAVVSAMSSLGFVGTSPSETFLGYVPIVKADTRRKCLVANLMTSLYNLACPARSVSDEREGDAILGAGPRDAHYATNPNYVTYGRPAVIKLMSTMGVMSYEEAMKRRGPAVADANGEVFDIAALLTANFDAVYYKVKKSDIPEKWLDLHFNKILETDSQRWVSAANAVDPKQARRLVDDLYNA